jgi:hypothetical protein
MPLFRLGDGKQFEPFASARFEDLERDLEDWIESNPQLLSEREQFAIFARQVHTEHGKIADLLALDESGACVVVELKRGGTPRDVVAQCLEYAAWVASLDHDRFDAIARGYRLPNGASAQGIADVYQQAFLCEYADDEIEMERAVSRVTFNHRQRLIIVAEAFKPEIEQTIRYMRTNLGVDITAVRFGIHKAGIETIMETETIVGREAPGPPPAASLAQREPESDDAIRLRMETPFMRDAITAVEIWVGNLGRSDIQVRHRPLSHHAIMFNGHDEISYYYAKRWMFFHLRQASDLEIEQLRSSLSKPEQVVQRGNDVRFHVASHDDLHVLQTIIMDRIHSAIP